jgi:dTDP-4-dehydrorhamnose reductase
MYKILVTGAAGLLGNKIVKLHSEDYTIIGAYNKNKPDFKNSVQLDILKKRQFSIIEKIKPDIIIHTAGITNVDYCEDHREDAWKINVEGTKNIIDISKKIGSKIIFISTDYIFDGKNGPYQEEDEPNPINWYGKTKLEAEKLVESSNLEYIITRTTVLYGLDKYKLNFVTWIINELKNGRKIRVVTDQYGTPTLADNMAEILLQLILKDKQGIYNVVGSDLINRYQFALEIEKFFNLTEGLIIPIKTDELNQKAPRPKKGGLKVNKIKSELNINPLGIKDGLLIIKKQMTIK